MSASMSKYFKYMISIALLFILWFVALMFAPTHSQPRIDSTFVVLKNTSAWSEPLPDEYLRGSFPDKICQLVAGQQVVPYMTAYGEYWAVVQGMFNPAGTAWIRIRRLYTDPVFCSGWIRYDSLLPEVKAK